MLKSIREPSIGELGSCNGDGLAGRRNDMIVRDLIDS